MEFGYNVEVTQRKGCFVELVFIKRLIVCRQMSLRSRKATELGPKYLERSSVC